MMFKIALIEWGLGDYVSSFEDEGIDDESFKLMDNEAIRKIFPKCGPRLIFQNQFQKYIQTPPVDDATNSSKSDLEDSTSTTSTETLSDSYMFEPDAELSLSLVNTFSIPQSPIKQQERATENVPPGKRARIVGHFHSVFPEGLTCVLKKYTDGHILIANKDKLNNDYRQKLCKIIINELIHMYGTEIRASTFFQVVEEIELIFKSERPETYYIPYLAGDKTKKGSGPKGKLWSRYVNVKAALRLANGPKHSVEKADTNVEQTSPEKDLLELQHLQFLNVGTEPFTKVLEAWEQTFRIRRKQYLHSDLARIFSDFPCLKINSGIELIETDFNRRFPDKTDIIYLEWPKIAAAILKEADERKLQFVSNIPEDIYTKALLLLPFLFSPVTLKKNRRGVHWRPTRSEVQESFFFHVENFDELQERVNFRKDKLQEYNVTLQPFGAIVGTSVISFFIVVDEIKYKVDSCVRVLELLYKLFHALDIEYPTECEHVWLFIQELVFCMKSNKKCPSTVTVVADITYHLTNN